MGGGGQRRGRVGGDAVNGGAVLGGGNQRRGGVGGMTVYTACMLCVVYYSLQPIASLHAFLSV